MLTHSHQIVKCCVLILLAQMSLLVTCPKLVGEEKTQSTIELGTPFADNIILQRQMNVPIWGWSKPGDTITVSFAGQQKNVVVGKNGKWLVELEPLSANATPSDMTISNGASQTIKIKNVLVGEVWLASGQSNMDWLAGKSLCNALAGTIGRENLPIRELALDSGSSLFPSSRSSSKDGWKLAQSASSFSALALSFAYDLHKELQVPIGIIRSSHGATPIETWTAYEGFADHPKLQDIAALIRASNPMTTEGQQAFEQYYKDLWTWQAESEKIINKGGKALQRPKLPGICDDWKGASRMFNKKIAPLIPSALRGAIWCQGEHNSDDGSIYAAKMEALINGWRKNWKRPNLPFYFTQMQCYGEANPDNIGFADIRAAQTLFFVNAEHVGMAAQHDLNPNPGNIHYSNKLDPGKRLARWALAHQYGKDIAYTGPLYKSHVIEGNTVRIQFEQRGPGGGLMVGSKGMEIDAKKNPDAYVEPARETPGEPLQHFRLAGKDKKWHAAVATIVGDEVHVISPDVPEPVGVQYAYNASPIGANLYNKAGLPAIPFCLFDGKPYFPENDAELMAARKAELERKYGHRAYLQPATLFRDGAILQRDCPLPVWGHGIPGSTITVDFAGQKKTAVVNEFEFWRVTLDPLSTSTSGRDLIISSDKNENKVIKDIQVGDVWVITGARAIPNTLCKLTADSSYKPLANVREFRIRTNARRFPTPRKERMEIGGGKYESSWQTIRFDDRENVPSVFAYHFAIAAHSPDVPLGIITLGSENPPLTWVSYAAMQTAVGFETQRDELNLAYPNTEVCKKAIQSHIDEVKKYCSDIANKLQAGEEIPVALAESSPPFPTPYYNQWVSRTETATHTYNFCISPLTPNAVRGVVWVPEQDNISDNVAHYAPSLALYAASLPQTYEQPVVPFLFVQPSEAVVPGITAPTIKNATRIDISEWPKNWSAVATQLGEAAAKLP